MMLRGLLFPCVALGVLAFAACGSETDGNATNARGDAGNTNTNATPDGKAPTGSDSGSAMDATNATDSSAPLGGVGAACADADNCEAGLICFVKTNEAMGGTCVDPPGACADKLGCACVDELETQCANGARCIAILGKPTVACIQNGAFKQQGEACSRVIACEIGLYCFSHGAGQTGTCLPLPTECGSSPKCDCFGEAKQQCTSGETNCTSISGQAFIQCR
jgi:hypothetical protein